MIQVLEFWVPGAPKTKGSMSARAPKCHCSPQCRGYARLPQLRDSEGSKRWRKLVAYQAEQAMRGEARAWPMAGPLGIEMDFSLSVAGMAELIAQGAGDNDKLERNVFDALQDAGAIENDSQFIWNRASKAVAMGRGPGVPVLLHELI